MTVAVDIGLAPGSVKICGLSTPKHAGAAALGGADLIGLIFAPSRRRVTPEVAGQCIRAARLAAGCRRLLAVGVFVNEPAVTINAVAAHADLDLVQLNGDEAPSLLGELDRPAVKALRIPTGGTVGEAEELIAPYLAATKPPLAFLVDGYDPVHFGGQGVRADWDVAQELARRYPLLLAGGLDGANVEQAIRQVQPLGVDVSSGVETEGIKDVAKITGFIGAARQGFEVPSTPGRR
ncbi:MAG: phosphoribosylanthranilate isomerase [Thermomicrobiales bacterium]